MNTIRLTTASITVEATITNAAIAMTTQFFNSPVSTKKFLALIPTLDRKLPSIFKNKCFNDHNLPFREEVLSTPLGHLFEHILLEYVCDELEYCGLEHICMRGETEWNWDQDPVGLYHITLSGMTVTKSQLTRALNQTILLTDEIIHETEIPTAPILEPAYVFTTAASFDAQKTTNGSQLLDLESLS